MIAEYKMLCNCIISGVLLHSHTSFVRNVVHTGDPLREIPCDPDLEIKRKMLLDRAKGVLQLVPFCFTFDIGIVNIDHEAKVGVQLQGGKDTKKTVEKSHEG